VLIRELLELDGVSEGHHGDCIGADRDFDGLCGMYGIVRHAHPGTGKGDKRAYCPAEVVHDPLPYLDRNKVIVQYADILIACPQGPERLRSGTWSTVRYARKVETPVILIWPNGVIER